MLARWCSLPLYHEYLLQVRLCYPAEWANRVPKPMTYKHACRMCVAEVSYIKSMGQGSVLCDDCTSK